MIDYWFSYSSFHFSPREIIWALQNYEYFGRGEWPPLIGNEHGEYLTDEEIHPDKSKGEKRGKWIQVIKSVSTYSEPPVRKRRVKTDGYFVNTAIVKAEIDTRLKSTKEAGETLIWEIEQGLSDIELLSPMARSALFYMSGAWRKKQTYPQWRADKKRTHKSMVLSERA